MINRYELTKEQALFAIMNGEFSNEVIASNKKVVIILTQDWCPQWSNMKTWVYTQELDFDLDIYELIYNKVDYFKEFIAYKESFWQNYDIPYLRYYNNGKLFKESNYKNQKNFKDIINSSV